MKRGIREAQILVLIKRPNEPCYAEPLFDNDLESFQKAVQGYIEPFYLSENELIVCDEEGLLKGLQFNTCINDMPIFGTIVCCGQKGEEFCSLKAQRLPFLMQLLDEGGYSYDK